MRKNSIYLIFILFLTNCNIKKGPLPDEVEVKYQDTVITLDTLTNTTDSEQKDLDIGSGEKKNNIEVKPKVKPKRDITITEEGTIKRKPLTLIINNLPSATAPVIVGVYGSMNKFPDPQDQLKEYRFKTNSNVLSATISDLEFGTYAIAIYQDENSNGKIDKNLIGVPTEAYAFSNNYKPTVKAPGFNNCAFNYCDSIHTITVKMIK